MRSTLSTQREDFELIARESATEPILEHLSRAEFFAREGRYLSSDDPAKFRFGMAGLYFCAASREQVVRAVNGYRDAPDSELKKHPQVLRAKEKVVHWSLVGKIRRKDFHERPFYTPTPGVSYFQGVAGSRGGMRIHGNEHGPSQIQFDLSKPDPFVGTGRVSPGDLVSCRDGMFLDHKSGRLLDPITIITEFSASLRSSLMTILNDR